MAVTAIHSEVRTRFSISIRCGAGPPRDGAAISGGRAQRAHHELHVVERLSRRKGSCRTGDPVLARSAKRSFLVLGSAWFFEPLLYTRAVCPHDSRSSNDKGS